MPFLFPAPYITFSIYFIISFKKKKNKEKKKCQVCEEETLKSEEPGLEYLLCLSSM